MKTAILGGATLILRFFKGKKIDNSVDFRGTHLPPTPHEAVES